MEVVSAVVAKIAELLVDPIGQWLCYSFDYDSNIKTLEDQLETLKKTRDSVQDSVDSATRNGEVIEALVTAWLTKVDKIIEEARKVVPVEERVQARCSNGACLNMKLRHQLSRKAKKMVQVIGEVMKEYDRFKMISYRPPPPKTTKQKDYMDLESRMSTVKGLMEALGDANTNVIGVWGMAGAGKTTLVREVARQAKEKKLFDEVAMADVTQNPNHRRIQGEIADKLDLKLGAESERGRADRLKQRLTTHKKILVILDDIWSILNLEEIGIPSTGCKVVLTSRDKDLLSCQMGTQKDFGLEELLENEAWDLFEKMAGDCVIKDRNLRCKATEVAKECAGLPIALVTVAKALKDKELFEWNNALQLLRRPTLEGLTRMQSTIYSSIELSYSHLESMEVKHLFLLCAEMSHFINYLDLLKYCYGLGLFHGINTLEEARNRLYSHLRKLKNSCLLLDCPHGSEHCHMHDVVRDVAIFIASRDHNMFVVRDTCGLKTWPDVDALKRCTTFSIRGGDIHELPNEIECPDLRFFYVNGGDRSLQIPKTFFEGMGKLQVLDLTKMKIPSLPSSLGLLRKLQTLCLDHCVLGDMAVLRELKNLVVLSLFSSNMSQLPSEIGSLTRLRLLDLSKCAKLEVIPPNVLSRLVELEQLYMGNSVVQWEAEGLTNERNNASLAELKHLSQLIALEIYIRDVSNLPKDLLFEKLERYAICVGDHVWDSSSEKRKVSRTLKIKLNTSFQAKVGMKMLLKRTEALYLDELKGVKSLLNELDREGFQQLKHLHIQNNPEIKYIIILRISVVAFPALETFLLKNMMSLEEICHGQLPLTSFRNLRIVKVEHCDKLKFVFSSSMARGLSQLEELEVRECSMMGAIVMKEGEIQDTDAFLFPQLRRLALEHLPQLMSFLSTQNPLIANAGEIISEGKLDFHMPILHEQVVFPILETLELSSVNLAEIEQAQHPARSSCRLANTQATSRFENLSSLEVRGSSNIKYILSFSTARFMVQLKHLHIFECEVVEEILVTEELGVVEEITPEPKVLFPQLECLFLQKLPTLKRFCVGSNIEFQSLKHLRIENCPKLETFISKPLNSGVTISKEVKEMSAEETTHSVMQPLFNDEVAFPSLERLTISHVDCLKIIWKNQFTINSFCKLQFMGVKFCENLMNIFHYDMLTRFQSLEQLAVINCGVEEIVAGEKGAEAIATFMFPQITDLCLKDLSRLKWFYHGMQALEWPMLKSLIVDGCQKVEIFASKLLSFQETLQDSPVEISIKQPLFLVDEATFPNLEVLFLGQYDTIWRGQFLEDCFCKLKVLHLCNHHNKSAVSPPHHFVKRVHNLEKLVVCHTDWEEIFPYEELLGQEKHAGILTQLRELNLIELPKLTHLWNEDTQPCSILHNLEILKVSKCGKLKILVPSSVSFQNLAELEILKCHGLINLVTSSTAKSLVQLKKMSVSECKRITEIVRGGRGEANEVITFSKLTSLKLDWLPQLSDFCSGGYSFEFPSLEEVIVSQCQEMKIFSHGVLSTPKLKRVQATKGDEGHWKDDLNTTIHWLWEGNCDSTMQWLFRERVQNSEEDKDHP